MKRNSEYLKNLAGLFTINNLYRESLSMEDLLLMQCLLLVLRKKNLLKEIKIPGQELGLIEKNIDKSIHSGNENSAFLAQVFINCFYEKKYDLTVGELIEIIWFYEDLSDEFIKNHATSLFDTLLKSYFNDSGKRNIGVLQPLELTLLINSFIPVKDSINYYNPFAGLASLGLNLPSNVNYFGEEIIEFNWILAQLRIQIYNCSNVQLDRMDSIESWTKEAQYDFIAFNPPFNLKPPAHKYLALKENNPYFSYSNINSFIVSECLKRLTEDGTMVFLMPDGFLTSQKSTDKSFRKFLVEYDYLNYVISLPERSLNYTSVAISLIVISKKRKSKNHTIKFIDASSLYINENQKINKIDNEKIIDLINNKQIAEFSRVIEKAKIAQNDYQLNVGRYVFDDLEINFGIEDKLMALEDLMFPAKLINNAEKIGKLATIKNLSTDSLNSFTSFPELETKDLRKSAYKLDNNTLLLSKIGPSLKPTYYKSSAEPIFFYPSQILAFKIKENIISPDYLILELQKDYVIEQLKRKQIGSAVPRFIKKDILDIQIVVPSLEQQEVIKYESRESILKEEQEKFRALSKAYGIDVADENSFLRHQIAGRLKNIRGAFISLKTIIEEQVNVKLPDLYEYKKEDKLPNTFKTYMDIIERDLASINNSVKSVGTSIEILESNAEKINLINFVSDYLGELEGRSKNNFIIDLNIDETLLNESNIKGIFINGDRDLLTKMLDNVIDNIEKHGFQNSPVHKRRIAIEFMYDFENNNVQIDFANTGNPLPENLDYEIFIRKGSAFGENAGDGTGVNFIYEVMKKHNGNFGFTDETDVEGVNRERDTNEIVTSIELTFPITVELKK